MLKRNFHRNKNLSNDLYKHCKSCRKRYYIEKLLKIKKYYLDNQDRKKEYCLNNRDQMKDCYSKNCDKITARKKIQSNNKYKTDTNLCLIENTRSRIYHALKGRSKSFSMKGNLGIDIETNEKKD